MGYLAGCLEEGFAILVVDLDDGFGCELGLLMEEVAVYVLLVKGRDASLHSHLVGCRGEGLGVLVNDQHDGDGWEVDLPPPIQARKLPVRAGRLPFARELVVDCALLAVALAVGAAPARDVDVDDDEFVYLPLAALVRVVRLRDDEECLPS